MSGIDGMESPSEVAVDPSLTQNIMDDEDDWVIVKKQRVTILIPPLSPAATCPQAGMPKLRSRQTSLPKMTKRNYNAATKKQVTKKKCRESSLEGLGVDGRMKTAQTHPSDNIVRQDDTTMRGQSSQGPAAPVVKSNWTKHADHATEGPSHQAAELTSSPQSTYELGLPIISSHLTNKVLRARLLQRRVAQFGGLRNWLLTCGLGWFVNILDSEEMGMYQIVSLTMNQLKEMGLIAVGPRRKLIHAIDSLSKPHQFEMFS